MGTIYYVCDSCADNYPEGSCHPREDVRALPDGTWICESCFEDAPTWTWLTPPNGDDDAEQPRWSTLPPVPEYRPVTEPATAQG